MIPLADMPWLLATTWRPHVDGTPTDWEYIVWVDDEQAESALGKAPDIPDAD